MDCGSVIPTDITDLNESIFISEPEFEILGDDFRVFPDETLSSEIYEFDHLYTKYPEKFINKSNLVDLLKNIDVNNEILSINGNIYSSSMNNLVALNRTIESRLTNHSFDNIITHVNTSNDNNSYHVNKLESNDVLSTVSNGYVKGSQIINDSNLNYEGFKSDMSLNITESNEVKSSLDKLEIKENSQIQKIPNISSVQLRNKNPVQSNLFLSRQNTQSNSKSSLTNLKMSNNSTSTESITTNLKSDNCSSDNKSNCTEKSSMSYRRPSSINSSKSKLNKPVLEFNSLKSQNKENQSSRISSIKPNSEVKRLEIKKAENDILNTTFENSDRNSRIKRQSLIMTQNGVSKFQKNNSNSVVSNPPSRPSSLFQKPTNPISNNKPLRKLIFKPTPKPGNSEMSALHLPVQSPLTPTVSTKSMKIINNLDKTDEQNNNDITSDFSQLSINTDTRHSDDNPLNRTYDAQDFEALKSTNIDIVDNNNNNSNNNNDNATSGDITPTNDDIAEQENRFRNSRMSSRTTALSSSNSKRAIPKPASFSRLPTSTSTTAVASGQSRIAQPKAPSKGLIKPKMYNSRKK